MQTVCPDTKVVIEARTPNYFESKNYDAGTDLAFYLQNNDFSVRVYPVTDGDADTMFALFDRTADALSAAGVNAELYFYFMEDNGAAARIPDSDGIIDSAHAKAFTLTGARFRIGHDCPMQAYIDSGHDRHLYGWNWLMPNPQI